MEVGEITMCPENKRSKPQPGMHGGTGGVNSEVMPERQMGTPILGWPSVASLLSTVGANGF